MERRISTILLMVLLLNIGLFALRGSGAERALAQPGFRPVMDAPWGANVQVNDDASGALQVSAAIAVDGSGNAYAVWGDYRNGDSRTHFNSDIYFSYRPAGGDWGPNLKVNDDAGTSEQWDPAIAVDGSGNAYAVWHDARNGWLNRDIYFSYRPAGGDWGPNLKVNDDAGPADQWSPSIAVDSSGNAYAVWEDDRDVNRDIYFSYRLLGGDWGPNVKVNDDAGTTGQWAPAIAVDGSSNAYAVWTDERNGNPDIYFSYRPAEEVTPTPTPTATSTPVAILTPEVTPVVVEATPAPIATPTPLQIPSPTATPHYEEGWLTPRSVLALGGLVFCGGVTALIILVVGLLVLRKR